MAGASPEPLGCPDDDALRAVVSGGQVDGWVEDHLGSCEDCRSRMDSIAGGEFTDLSLETDGTQPSEALEEAMAALKTQPMTSSPVDVSEWLEPSDDPGLMGMLDRYEVRRVIEEGGMGIVLEAWDPELEREVAIKLIKPARGQKSQARDRLLREARAAAGFTHDTVVPIYAVEILKGNELPFIVMPLVRGGSLQDRMDSVRGPLPLEETVAIGRQVAEALEAAHEKGMLHRDIKPANILLRGDGKIWVADFGLARTEGEEQLTGDGSLSGTPQFMAPEQVDGRNIDHRADLFSLGGVLYQMVTGKPAFSGKSGLEIVRAVADRRHEAVAGVNPETPKWLADLVEALLEKKPERRPEAAGNVVRAFEEHEFQQRAGTGSAKLWLVALAMVVVFGIAALILTRPSTSENTPRPVVDQKWMLEPFQIPAAQFGGETLAEAVSAARDGDVIEIRRDGVVQDEPLDLGGKSLTLRAGLGFAPIFLAGEIDQPLLWNTAPLRLEGFRFTSASGLEGLQPPFIRAEAPLVVANCNFARVVDGRTTIASRGALISLDGAERVAMTNVAVFSSDAPVIGLASGEHEIDLRNCLFVSPSAIFPKHMPTERTRVSFLNSSFHGKDFVLWKQTINHFSPMDVVAKSSVFEKRGGIFAMPRRTYGEIEGKVTFSGEKNLYSLNGHYLSFGAVRRAAGPNYYRPEIETGEEWRVHWGLAGNGDAECEMDFIQRGVDLLRKGGEITTDLVPSELAAEKYPDRGIRADVGGPRRYKAFRGSSSYAEWDKRATAVMGR